MICNICNADLESEPIVVINNPDRFELAIGESEGKFLRTWHECTNCTSLQTIHNKGSKDKLSEIAGSYYKIDFGDTEPLKRFKRIMSLPHNGSDNYYRVERIRKFYDKWTEVNRHDNEKRILDIGGGLGVFMQKFLEVNSDFEGTMMEPDHASTSHLSEVANFDFRQEYFHGQPQFERQFDIVTLNKVAEHIEKPQQLLKDIRGSLKANTGILYLELPDVLNSKFKNTNDNSLGSLHHNLYNFKSIDYLLSSTGYFTIQMERIYEPSGKISIYAFAADQESVPFIFDK